MNKTIALILLLSALEISSSIAASIDQEKCKGRRGKYPKPGSLCRSFYRCNNWVPKEKQCPGDKLFDPSKAVCVTPELYSCLEGTVSPSSPVASGKVDRSKCKKRHGNFPKPGSMCRSYYECTNWAPVEMDCPWDEHFFPAKEYCVRPEDFPCLEEPESKECLHPNGKFLKPGTGCKFFYDCCGGKPTLKMCPEDLLFDPKSETCEKSETCVEVVTSIEPTKSTITVFTSPKISTITVYPDSSEEDSDESNEKTRSSTVFEKISSITFSESSTFVTTPDPDSSEEDSNESNESIRSSTVYTKVSTTASLEPSTFTPSSETKDDEYSTASEGDLKTVNSDPATASTRNLASTTVEENWTSSSLEPASVTEENPNSISTNDGMTTSSLITISVDEEDTNYTPSKHDLTTFSLKPLTVSEENTDSTVSKKDLTTSSLSPVSISEDITDSTTENDNFASSSLPPVSIREDNTDSTISTDGVSTPSLQPVSVTEGNTDFISEDNFTTSSVEPESISEENTGSTSLENDSTTPNVKTASTSTINTGSTASEGGSTTVHIFCPEPSGYFPHPTDRHKFIGCVGGEPRIIECPSKLVYNHKKRACDYDKKSPL